VSGDGVKGEGKGAREGGRWTQKDLAEEEEEEEEEEVVVVE